jgi:tetratricopeptide (TPR) repeat protein
MTRPLVAAGVLAALLVGGGCGKQAPPPRPPSAEMDDYIFPGWRPDEVSKKESQELQSAWGLLQAGEAAQAEKRYRKILSRAPGLVAAETGLAYARLRLGQADEAARLFESTLGRRPDYVPALAGLASAALRRGKPEDALPHLRRAAALDRANEVAQRRFAEVRLQVTDRKVAAAREAALASRVEEAKAAYRQALDVAPELSGVRLELADLLAREGATDEASALLEGDPSGERQILLRLAEIREKQEQLEGALDAYRKLLAQDPADREALAGSRRIRHFLELRQMPEEYRRIVSLPSITRADLAAILAVKLTALSKLPPGRPRVAIDISGSWARDHIIRALSFDLLPVYPNHTFQPGATVRRGDLARAVQQVLDLMQVPARPGPAVTDMSSANPVHYSAARAVAAGLMDLSPAGAFEPWRPVSGQQAVDVIEALARLVGP